MANDFAWDDFLYDVEHYTYDVLNEDTGEIKSVSKNCGRYNCKQSWCRDWALKKRVQAVRFVARRKKLKLVTVSKIVDTNKCRLILERFIRAFKKSGGGDVYGVVERHSTGLYHLHFLTDFDGDIEKIYWDSVYLEAEGLTVWSDLKVVPSGPHAVQYILKNFRKYPAEHLGLNSRNLQLRYTRNFFRVNGVGNIEIDSKEEGYRAKLFGVLVRLVGAVNAKRLTAGVVESERLAGYIYKILIVLLGLGSLKGGWGIFYKIIERRGFIGSDFFDRRGRDPPPRDPLFIGWGYCSIGI